MRFLMKRLPWTAVAKEEAAAGEANLIFLIQKQLEMKRTTCQEDVGL